MNDKYLFRGQRIDYKDKYPAYFNWVTGCYFKTPLTVENFEAGHLGNGIKRHCISDENGVVYEVIPETVSQYTGLNDKKGKKIFDGDRVTNKTKSFDRYGKNLNLKIKWNEEELYYDVLQKDDDRSDEDIWFHYKKLTKNLAKHIEIV